MNHRHQHIVSNKNSSKWPSYHIIMNCKKYVLFLTTFQLTPHGKVTERFLLIVSETYAEISNEIYHTNSEHSILTTLYFYITTFLVSTFFLISLLIISSLPLFHFSNFCWKIATNISILFADRQVNYLFRSCLLH